MEGTGRVGLGDQGMLENAAERMVVLKVEKRDVTVVEMVWEQ